MSGLVALALSALSASACLVTVHIACPTDTTAKNILVCINGVGCAYTDDLGLASIPVPRFDTYTVCIDKSTLPAGAKLSPACQKIVVDSKAPPTLEFVISGPFCSPQVAGFCWMTGGGTVGKTQGTPNYSYGGVIYPGCSPFAADGGNWNVVDHFAGVHFQGKVVTDVECSGDPTSSPKVSVNIIDFDGTGAIGGIAENDEATIPVNFTARAIDNHDGGAGSDQLYLLVTDLNGNTVMQIGASRDNPATISTGNIQIHQSSCK
jgi:hypothetical protein